MKSLKNNKNSFKPHLAFYMVALACLFFGSLQSAQAQLVTIAQFTEKNGTNDFVLTNNGGTSATFGTISGGVPVDFRYFNVAGLPASLQGFQDARVFTSATTSVPATTDGTTLTQPFSGVNVIQILRDTAAPVGVGTGTRRNLLTITFSPNTVPPVLTGIDNGNAASFVVTTPQNTVVYTSDFLTFPGSVQRNWSLSFSSLVPALTRGAGNFLTTFTGAGAGTFSANPAPVFGGPTAATVSVSGRVLTAAGRGLRNAQVTVTEADGSSRTILTGNFGQYNFTDLAAGQTVVLTVRSKRYRFTPQIITLTEDLNELDFLAEP